MKCYYHPHVDAVTHCAVCARPLCSKCAVVVRGKVYCEQHAEKILAREERSESLKHRGTAIATASIIAELDGLAGVVVGFLLMLLGLLEPAAAASPILGTTVGPFISYFAAVSTFPSDQVLLLGFVLLALGVTDMIAGYYLWRRSKVAAILSVAVASIAGGLIGGYLVIIALAGAFTYIYIVSAIVKIVAIGAGWNHLSSVGAPAEARTGHYEVQLP